MKLRITDTFLWDAYKILEKGGDVSRFLFSPYYKKFSILRGQENPIFAKYRKEKGAKEFAKLIYYLKTNNYIRVKQLEGGQGIMLTKEGISKALKASFAVEKRQKRKDGKWIMLTFDIPQARKKARLLLRSILANLGYKMFQQSIWVNPFEVTEETKKLLQMHSLERYVKIFLIEEMTELKR